MQDSTPHVMVLGDATFRYLEVTLQPGQELVAEAGSMASMSSKVDLSTSLNGNFLSALLKRFFGGESLFINRFTNHSNGAAKVVLTGGLPGDVVPIQLNGDSYNLEPGSYLCSTSNIRLTLRWAGFASFMAREGLFKLVATGRGTIWINGYGKIFERQIKGDLIVDSGHLVAYQPSISLKLQLANGIFGSFFSGEGFVSKLSGEGKVLLQTRSIGTLASWLNTRI